MSTVILRPSSDISSIRRPSEAGTRTLCMVEAKTEPQIWTISHSYYANMGGIVGLKMKRVTDDCWGTEYSVIRGDDVAGRPLTELPFGHPISGVRLSAADIKDKSKADWIAKTVASFQIARLLLDILNRVAQGQPITQLELATAAFAVFAIVTYFVSVRQPKGVGHPTILDHLTDTDNEGDEAKEHLTQSFFALLLHPMAQETRGRVKNDEIWMVGKMYMV